ncbi:MULTISPECIES: FKBP-type peptidyl-prolyl cis-trans isomerase [Alcanivoracaceae]|jgi:FKBP-type peptidyl-prolyl cis-trans isomerase SlyD|uniref:Peptidyl-prolyl cis-trans isomerase n=3 Tax=Alcanivoracaceae TaxID=224372 RepID=A0A9Q3W369_9GAMM|nr:MULTISPECIES: peptidylprolyl isomerase [Alcanivoracaceae]ERS14167.1 peptidyl-prolyl cis-trans isomerase [Alcanivorax sp. PN-3]KYZ85460.1 peptidylprolyl isomerase [Alcanivorax sp. KX64203]MBA4722923.1 peptidylprolyl isomerase [Alcanivorax sp.]ARB47406.1 peptidylprolyl isomerase [Alloalcanivorax xenomutans]KAF0805686.1 FKBP-type peptidylprolyl isomerase [Alcanivorax xiamenensis]|tara:strand:+ start:378 stop:866 length:489 start_codon:yes stop_codon:yes gene_type:complete
MQIADNKVVAFHYTLTNNAGQTIDSSHQRQEPLTYLHGHGNIIPGLEKALVGKEVGDKLDVTVAPEEGYGERHDGLIQQVPASAFEGAGDELQPGMQFQAQTEAGPRIFTITEVNGDQVTIDGNHPLAGETLNFAVEITDIRESSEEEQQHGHVHGPDGHDH